MQFLRNQLPDFKNVWSCLILTFLRIEQYARYPPDLNYATTLPCKALTMKITINCHRRIFVCQWNSRKRSFLLMKTTFSWTRSLLLNIKMIVFGLLARKRCGQKSPGSRKGEICHRHHALCWCVLWRIRKTAFHVSQGKRKWHTLPWKSVTQTGWRLQVLCHLVSYSSKTERLLTRQSWLKTGLPPSAVTSSEKTNGHRTHQTSGLLSEELCVNADISTQAKYSIDELKKVL